MSRPRIKKVAVVAAISLLIVGSFLGMLFLLSKPIEIRGAISPRDLAAITRGHSSHCGLAWPGLNWFPVSIQKNVSAKLNPIEIIAVPKDGVAIVVYRGFNTYYYDKRGKHRWGTSSYTLVKDANGWH